MTIKYILDLIFSFAGIIILSPLWILLFLIMLENGPAIVYSQKRCGIDSKAFFVRKFRSMFINAEEGTGVVLATENDRRITKIGRILRSMAIDELPQLVNIVRGK
jgi:lipopolysaccharide/colanic/teichoic acid biosynthesis glycosyltransferase